MQREDRYRKPADVGSRSPTSEEAKRQGMSGDAGDQAGRTEGRQAQNAQGSDRRGHAHDRSPGVRRHFEPGHAPSEQGEKGHPSPQVIARHQQGMEPRGGDHAGGAGDESEERARSGEPRDEHATAAGRQHLPGSRAQNQRE